MKNLHTSFFVLAAVLVGVGCSKPMTSDPAAPVDKSKPATPATSADSADDGNSATSADPTTGADSASGAGIKEDGVAMSELGAQSDEKLIPADRGQGESDKRLAVDFVVPFVIPASKLNGIQDAMSEEKSGHFFYRDGAPIDGRTLQTGYETRTYCELFVDTREMRKTGSASAVPATAGSGANESYADQKYSGPLLVDDVYYSTYGSATVGKDDEHVANEAVVKFAPLLGGPSESSLVAIRIVKELVGKDAVSRSASIKVSELKSCFPTGSVVVRLVAAAEGKKKK